MRTRFSNALYAARSRLAFWLTISALLLGILGWFIVMNRAQVSVVMPFGFGTWVSPLALVIFASMAAGSLSTLAIQAYFATRRQLRKIYRRWQSPHKHMAHRAETPHIVSARPRAVTTSKPAMLIQENSND
ncbi:MAG: hypothetical protein ACKO5E_12855 [bacterium]